MFTLLPYISFNGEIVSENNVTLPITSGFLSGEGVFTTLKIKQSTSLFLDKHQIRLTENLKTLHFPIPKELASLEDNIAKLINKLELKECGIRITVFPDKNRPVTLVHAFQLPEEEQNLKLISTPETRDSLRYLKTINRIINNQALEKAKQQNAHDALFVSDRKLIEATNSSIFSINRDGTLITPNVKGVGLDSITKQVLQEYVEIIETDIPEDTEGPLVLVSSLRTRSVQSINGRKLRDAGKILQRIIKFREVAENEYIAAHRK